MIFDYSTLLNTTGGDKDLAKELIDIFIDEYGLMLDDVASAVHRNQAQELHAAAHKFKGSLRSMGAGEVLDIILALETMGINEDMDQAESVFEKLKPALDLLVVDLRNFEGVTAG